MLKDFEETYPLIKNNLDFLRTKGVEIRSIVEERLRNETFLEELVDYVKIRYSGHINHNMLIADDKTAFQSVKAHFDITKPSAEDYIIFSSTNTLYVMYIAEIIKRRWDNAVE